MKKNGVPVEILLVEDNVGDVFLAKKAFEKSSIVNNLSVARDGDIAVDMLLKKGEYKDSTRPDIILLDINLPKRNGHEVLEFIKKDDGLKSIPVIMLTSSKSEVDVSKSYQRYASGYISKPDSASQFQEVVSAIESFWCSTVTLPQENS